MAALQISHVLADGARSSAMAARLFGRAVDIEPVTTPRLRGIKLPWRGLLAARTHRQLVRDTASGLVPAQAEPRPVLRTNSRPSGARSVRTLIRHRDRLPGPTVTIGVLCAVSTALSAHLRSLGDDPSTLGAEVPMAKITAREANNHFGNVGVGLYPELDFGRAGDANRRRPRRSPSARPHPAMRAASRAFAVDACTAAALGRRTVRPDRAIADRDRKHHRLQRQPWTGGPALRRRTRGGHRRLPALSPMMGLTHGVHGIGDTVAVSVHAAESAIGDVDEYVARLDAALSG